MFSSLTWLCVSETNSWREKMTIFNNVGWQWRLPDGAESFYWCEGSANSNSGNEDVSEAADDADYIFGLSLVINQII